MRQARVDEGRCQQHGERRHSQLRRDVLDGGTVHEHGRNAADQQFPRPGREQVERCRLVTQGQVQAANEAGDGQHHQDLPPVLGRGEGQQRWDKEVELFFNRERPHVQ
ncbi:hypothetical protein D3C79_947740 [compost metagenome]